MKGTQLVALALLVAGAGAFILLYERHQPTTDQVEERGDLLFPALERDQVVGLEITNSHGAFALAREGSSWTLTTPIPFPADEGAVSSLLGSLLALKRERTLAASEVKPADYGLDSPRLQVVLRSSDGARRTLSIGDESALGGSRAVSLGGGEVVLCSGWFVRDLDKPLADWRSRDVVDVFADQVASLTLEAEGTGSTRSAPASSGTCSSRWSTSPIGTSFAT